MTHAGSVAPGLIAMAVWTATLSPPPATQSPRTPGGVVMLAVSLE